MVEYEAKFTELSQFALDLVVTKRHKTIHFLNGL